MKGVLVTNLTLTPNSMLYDVFVYVAMPSAGPGEATDPEQDRELDRRRSSHTCTHRLRSF